MDQKKRKAQPSKQEPCNSFAYLAGLARKKETVIIYLNSDTIEDERQLKEIIVDVDNWTLAFLINDGRELLLFKHAVSFIEKVKEK